MTEYDFSQEAYEKYLAQQASVARWVEKTSCTDQVAPDFPPTPLAADTYAPLPRTKDRKSHSTRPSPAPSPPPPDQLKGSKSRKRSKSTSTPRRASTPFVPTRELPEPGCPIYNRNWDAEVSKAPKASTPPEPTPQSTSRERTRPHPRSNPDWPADFVPTPGLPEPGCPVYWLGPEKGPDDIPAQEPYRPPHPATRKRSMSFSAPASRPLDRSPQALQYYNSSGARYEHTNGHSGYWTSHNSSPNHPFTSSGPPIPPPHAPAPVPYYSVQNPNYHHLHHPHPDYAPARRQEIVRSHTVPALAHASHYSMDSTPYSYTTPGYSHQRSRPAEPVYQSHEQHQQQRPRPSSGPVSPTDTHSGSVCVTFPNGKTLYMTPPNSNRADILKHPDQYQVPHSYYISPKKEQKGPLLKRLFTFSKNNGGSSTKSFEALSGQSSPI